MMDLLIDELTLHDIENSLGCHAVLERRNLLVNTLSTSMSGDGLPILTIDRFIREGFGFHEFTNHVFMPHDELVKDDAVQVLWTAASPLPPLHTKIWFFQVKEMDFLDGQIQQGYLYDAAANWAMLPQTTMDSPLKVYEMFAGSFGGWKAATAFLQEHTKLKFQTVAVKSELNVAFAFALSHIRVNYTDLTGIMANKGNHPQMAFIQVNVKYYNLHQFTQIYDIIQL